MMERIESERQKQLEECIPGVWDHKTYLYVGANGNRFHYSSRLQEIVSRHQVTVDVVEISRSRACELMEKDFIRQVFWSDVCWFADGCKQEWDVIIWSHGPSCVPSFSMMEKTILKLRDKCKLQVLMCPWGKYPDYGAKMDYDRNFLAIYPEFFLKLRYSVNTLGLPDTAGSNLLAWSNINRNER